MRHIQELKYEDKPDYELLKKVFSAVFQRESINETDPYDWESEEEVLMANNATLRATQELEQMTI